MLVCSFRRCDQLEQDITSAVGRYKAFDKREQSRHRSLQNTSP
jgi:hypothetical protein